MLIKSLLSITLFPLVMRSRKADLPLATRARKQELCLHRYVSRMTRTENFLNQFFFSPFYATLFIVSRKYFFGFSKSAPTPRYTILDSRLPDVMRSRKADLPLATRARKQELCLYRYVSRMTRTENFINQNFNSFSGDHFSPRFMLPCSL